MSTVNKVYKPLFTRNQGQNATRASGPGTAAKEIAQVFSAGLKLVGQVAPVAAQFYPGGAGLAGLASAPLGGGLGNAGVGAGAGGGFDQMQLLQMQEQIQARSQMFQTVSNVSKAEHDAKMNAVRNVRP